MTNQSNQSKSDVASSNAGASNFVDENGDNWVLRVDRKMLRKVKKDTEILLSDMFLDDMALFNKICSDPLLAGDVLWSLCEEQATRRGMNAEQFETATDGDCFSKAVTAIVRAVVNSFPPERRAAIKKLFKTGETRKNVEIVITGLWNPGTPKIQAR